VPSAVVSILMPVHDAAPTLGAALQSVMRQRETGWECIAIDDGSTDRTPEILREAARCDARIKVARTDHRGIVSALGAGLELCTGRYVARMDSDDIMLRDRLGAQIAMLDADPSLAGVGTHVRIFPRGGRTSYQRWLNSLCTADMVARDAFVECPIAHPTWMMKRSTLASYGYRDMGWPEDYDLFLRMHVDGLRLGVVPRRLLLWRDLPTRLSRTSAACKADRLVLCKAHHLARGFLSGGGRYILWGYGDTGRALARALATEGKTPNLIVEVHPGRIGQTILGVPVVSPDRMRTGDALDRACGGHVVVSVAGDGPRADVRARAASLGLIEGRDFVCAA
jgi:glycosyltransferase involved in cell wall biosynthesis